MRNALLCVTTANQLLYTMLFYESFAHASPSGVDLIIVDDASEDGTAAYFRARGVRVISKERPRGLTDSWNLAYRIFRDERYPMLFLANNDILIPPGAIESMTEVLESHAICGPLTTVRGAGGQPRQAISQHLTVDLDPADPRNYIDIQRTVCARSGERAVRLPHLNGFFLGMNRSILRYERHDGMLFDSKNVNIGNENDLCARVREPKVCCLGAFVYHFKGRSFLRHAKAFSGRTLDRNYTWKEAHVLGAARRRTVIPLLRARPASPCEARRGPLAPSMDLPPPHGTSGDGAARGS